MFDIFINNYRGFVNQEIKFSRVNILIGENSSGKSSLLKLLLAIKQSFDSPLESNLKLSGPYVDLGNYGECVYYKKIRSHISFGFKFDDRYMDFFLDFIANTDDEEESDEEESEGIKLKKQEIIRYVQNSLSNKTKILFKISSKLHDHSTIQTVIENEGIGSLEIVQKKSSQTFEYIRKCNLIFDFGNLKGEIPNLMMSKDAFCSLVSGELLEICEKQFLEYGKEIFYKMAFLLVGQNYLREQFEKISYVNPINANPKRFYYKEDKKGAYVVNDIDKFINIMSDPTLKSKRREVRLNAINNILSSFGLAQEVRFEENKQLPVVGLQVKINDLWSDITDVGYGVSLQLPILFHALFSEMFARGGQSIIIEQPEVHLHPALQAKFIETLIGLGKKNSYFIETHSEHIIRKLQVLVKTKKISSSDISIHYFKKGDGKFDITSHSIEDSGALLPKFPKGFFDVSYSLVKELM